MTPPPMKPVNRAGPFRLSVVVPCFNEEAVIAATHERLTACLRALPGVTGEIVYVDDGGRDRTLELLRGIAARDAAVRVLVLSRNFGHQKALSAGLEHATGDAVVIIVSQRVSTIADAERIVVLEDGLIVGEGTHDALLATCPTYVEIVDSQLSVEDAA